MLRVLIAMTFALSAVAGAETRAEQRLEEGVARFEATDYAAAEAIFRELLTTDPENHEAAYRLGLALIAREQWDEALEVTARLSETVPENARYRRLYGEALGRVAERAPVLKRPGMAKRSLRVFEEAVALDPENLQARDSLMEFYLQAPGFIGGGLKKALAQADAIGKLDPWQGHRAKARIYRYEKEPAKAVAEYHAALERDPKNVAARHLLGQTHLELDDHGRAIETLEHGLETAPDHRPSLFELGRAVAGADEPDEKTLARGAEALERFLALPPRHLDPPAAEAWHHLGLIRRRQGNVDAARAAFRRALELDPGLDAARRALARP